MRAIQETVRNSFKESKKLHKQILAVAEMKNKVFDSLNDEQTLLFIRFIAEAGDLLKVIMFYGLSCDIMLLINNNGFNYARYVALKTNGGEQIEKRFTIKNRYN